MANENDLIKEDIFDSENKYESSAEEREVIKEKLQNIDEAKRIIENKYPHYGVIESFIDHLASTEKVFVLAGVKKFGGDEIMEMFIESETDVMADDTGIDKDVFDHIKNEFIKTHKNVSDIKEVSNKLREKYPDEEFHSDKFIQYLERYMIMLLEVSAKDTKDEFNIDKEKENAIYEIMKEVAENDELEIQKLKEIYKEFKDAMEKLQK